MIGSDQESVNSLEEGRPLSSPPAKPPRIYDTPDEEVASMDPLTQSYHYSV